MRIQNFKRTLITESKTYGSLDRDFVNQIVKLFQIESGSICASRVDESKEWKIVHRVHHSNKRTLGTLSEVLDLLRE